jgi:hypothetical protein
VIKRELNIRLICECLCDERLKGKVEGSTLLVYTGLCGTLEHWDPKIETRLIDERFQSVIGECVISLWRIKGSYLRVIPAVLTLHSFSVTDITQRGDTSRRRDPSHTRWRKLLSNPHQYCPFSRF